MPDSEQEMYRLVKENNEMLHAMRRRAFFGGTIKFVLYVLILVVAPLWLYSTYIQPIMREVNDTIEDIRGTKTSAASPNFDVQEALKRLQEQFSAGSAQ